MGQSDKNGGNPGSASRVDNCAPGIATPMDPSADAFLAGMPDQAAEAPGDEPVDAISVWRANMRAVIPLAGEPEAVNSIQDRTISTADGDLPLRIYNPDGQTGGAILYFHGGGFVGGDLDTIDTPLRRLANQSGRVIISVNYRLAPEHPYPAALDDAIVALEYVAENAKEFGISANRIAIMGDSAGGNIAAATAIRARDEDRPCIERQVLVYPDTDLTPEWFEHWPSVAANDGKMLQAEVTKALLAHYVGKADPYMPTVSPVLARDLAGLPPSLVVTAGHDLLCDEGTAYAERLEAAGVPTEHWHYPGQFHGFLQLAGVIPEGGELIDRLGSTLSQ